MCVFQQGWNILDHVIVSKKIQRGYRVQILTSLHSSSRSYYATYHVILQFFYSSTSNAHMNKVYYEFSSQSGLPQEVNKFILKHPEPPLDEIVQKLEVMGLSQVHALVITNFGFQHMKSFGYQSRNKNPRPYQGRGIVGLGARHGHLWPLCMSHTFHL